MRRTVHSSAAVDNLHGGRSIFSKELRVDGSTRPTPSTGTVRELRAYTLDDIPPDEPFVPNSATIIGHSANCTQVLVRKVNGDYQLFIDGILSQAGADGKHLIRKFSGVPLETDVQEVPVAPPDEPLVDPRLPKEAPAGGESLRRKGYKKTGFVDLETRDFESFPRSVPGPMLVAVVLEDGQTAPQSVVLKTTQKGRSLGNTLREVPIDRRELRCFSVHDPEAPVCVYPFPSRFTASPYVEVNDTQKLKQRALAAAQDTVWRTIQSGFNLLKNVPVYSTPVKKFVAQWIPGVLVYNVYNEVFKLLGDAKYGFPQLLNFIVSPMDTEGGSSGAPDARSPEQRQSLRGLVFQSVWVFIFSCTSVYYGESLRRAMRAAGPSRLGAMFFRQQMTNSVANRQLQTKNDQLSREGWRRVFMGFSKARKARPAQPRRVRFSLRQLVESLDRISTIRSTQGRSRPEDSKYRREMVLIMWIVEPPARMFRSLFKPVAEALGERSEKLGVFTNPWKSIRNIRAAMARVVQAATVGNSESPEGQDQSGTPAGQMAESALTSTDEDAFLAIDAGDLVQDGLDESTLSSNSVWTALEIEIVDVNEIGFELPLVFHVEAEEGIGTQAGWIASGLDSDVKELRSAVSSFPSKMCNDVGANYEVLAEMYLLRETIDAAFSDFGPLEYLYGMAESTRSNLCSNGRKLGHALFSEGSALNKLVASREVNDPIDGDEENVVVRTLPQRVSHSIVAPSPVSLPQMQQDCIDESMSISGGPIVEMALKQMGEAQRRSASALRVIFDQWESQTGTRSVLYMIMKSNGENLQEDIQIGTRIPMYAPCAPLPPLEKMDVLTKFQPSATMRRLLSMIAPGAPDKTLADVAAETAFASCVVRRLLGRSTMSRFDLPVEGAVRMTQLEIPNVVSVLRSFKGRAPNEDDPVFLCLPGGSDAYVLMKVLGVFERQGQHLLALREAHTVFYRDAGIRRSLFASWSEAAQSLFEHTTAAYAKLAERTPSEVSKMQIYPLQNTLSAVPSSPPMKDKIAESLAAYVRAIQFHTLLGGGLWEGTVLDAEVQAMRPALKSLYDPSQPPDHLRGLLAACVRDGLPEAPSIEAARSRGLLERNAHLVFAVDGEVHVPTFDKQEIVESALSASLLNADLLHFYVPYGFGSGNPKAHPAIFSTGLDTATVAMDHLRRVASVGILSQDSEADVTVLDRSGPPGRLGSEEERLFFAHPYMISRQKGEVDVIKVSMARLYSKSVLDSEPTTPDEQALLRTVRNAIADGLPDLEEVDRQLHPQDSYTTFKTKEPRWRRRALSTGMLAFVPAVTRQEELPRGQQSTVPRGLPMQPLSEEGNGSLWNNLFTDPSPDQPSASQYVLQSDGVPQPKPLSFQIDMFVLRGSTDPEHFLQQFEGESLPSTEEVSQIIRNATKHLSPLSGPTNLPSDLFDAETVTNQTADLTRELIALRDETNKNVTKLGLAVEKDSPGSLDPTRALAMTLLSNRESIEGVVTLLEIALNKVTRRGAEFLLNAMTSLVGPEASKEAQTAFDRCNASDATSVERSMATNLAKGTRGSWIAATVLRDEAGPLKSVLDTGIRFAQTAEFYLRSIIVEFLTTTSQAPLFTNIVYSQLEKSVSTAIDLSPHPFKICLSEYVMGTVRRGVGATTQRISGALYNVARESTEPSASSGESTEPSASSGESTEPSAFSGESTEPPAYLREFLVPYGEYVWYGSLGFLGLFAWGLLKRSAREMRPLLPKTPWDMQSEPVMPSAAQANATFTGRNIRSLARSIRNFALGEKSGRLSERASVMMWNAERVLQTILVSESLRNGALIRFEFPSPVKPARVVPTEEQRQKMRKRIMQKIRDDVVDHHRLLQNAVRSPANGDQGTSKGLVHSGIDTGMRFGTVGRKKVHELEKNTFEDHVATSDEDILDYVARVTEWEEEATGAAQGNGDLLMQALEAKQSMQHWAAQLHQIDDNARMYDEDLVKMQDENDKAARLCTEQTNKAFVFSVLLGASLAAQSTGIPRIQLGDAPAPAVREPASRKAPPKYRDVYNATLESFRKATEGRKSALAESQQLAEQASKALEKHGFVLERPGSLDAWLGWQRQYTEPEQPRRDADVQHTGDSISLDTVALFKRVIDAIQELDAETNKWARSMSLAEMCMVFSCV